MLPDDSMAEQLKGYLSAIKNDVITPMGLPFATLDKAQFDRLVEMTGIDRAWAMDMASFTATELVGAATGALALALNWN